MRRVLIHLTLSTCALAQSEPPALHISQDAAGNHPLITLCEENDIFAIKNEDKYYTQGLRLSYQNNQHYYWAIAQEINTPRDTTHPVPSVEDLPYSGVLYLTYGYGEVLERGGRRDCMFTVEGQVGVTGPASGAETIQSKFHEVINIGVPAGWGSQIPSEPVFNLNAEFKRRLIWDDSGRHLRDVIAHGQIQVGTIRTELVLGAQLRWGFNLENSWGQGTLRHSSVYDSNYASHGMYPREFSSYFFTDAQVELVFKNYATDGTTFRESGHVKRTPVVGQLMMGTTASIYRAALTYYMVVRSKEFETQQMVHYFGGFKGDIRF